MQSEEQYLSHERIDFMEMKIERIHENATLPQYAHEGDSGLDLYAVEDTIIEPGQRLLVNYPMPKGRGL